MWLWGKGMDEVGKQVMANVVMEQGDGISEGEDAQVCGYGTKEWRYREKLALGMN